MIIVISVAMNSGGHTINTTGTGPTGSSATTGGDTKPASAPKTAGIGSAITLAGNDGGEQMSVTLVKVIGSASPDSSGFDGRAVRGSVLRSPVPTGRQRVRRLLRLARPMAPRLSIPPAQSYDSSLADTVDGCTSFPGTENIAPGSSGLGCIVFEVPRSAKIVSVQFTLDSGFGPQTGQWRVG